MYPFARENILMSKQGASLVWHLHRRGMVVKRKPFETIAECEMVAFPTGADIERVSEQIEMARASYPNVVQATVSPPAIFRDRRYVLQTRFVVWSDDGTGATRAVEGLLKHAGVACRTMLPSGRALTEAATPPPPELVKSAPPTKRARARAAKSAQQTRGKTPRVLAVKPGPRAGRSGTAVPAPKAGARRGTSRTAKSAVRRRRHS